MIGFACVNESASTCMTAMDVPGASEWSTIYDANGHVVINAHHGISLADQKRARTLGLWRDLWSSRETDEAPFVYK